jgi:hypothetical protein
MNGVSDKMRHIDDRRAIEIGRYTRIDPMNQGLVLALASSGWVIASRYVAGSLSLAQTVSYLSSLRQNHAPNRLGYHITLCYKGIFFWRAACF